MMHHMLSLHSGHYGVNQNSDKKAIIVQLMDDRYDQIRVAMTTKEVDHFIELLQKAKSRVEFGE